MCRYMTTPFACWTYSILGYLKYKHVSFVDNGVHERQNIEDLLKESNAIYHRYIFKKYWMVYLLSKMIFLISQRRIFRGKSTQKSNTTREDITTSICIIKWITICTGWIIFFIITIWKNSAYFCCEDKEIDQGYNKLSPLIYMYEIMLYCSISEGG